MAMTGAVTEAMEGRPAFRRRAVAALAALAAAAFLAACGGGPSDDAAGVGGPGAGTGIGTGVGGAPTPGSAQEFSVTVGDRVYFVTNSSTLTADARAVLDRQAQWLRLYPTYRVMIEGHADERGTREYNLALGARRATAVRDYLVAQGIDPSRLATISYGKERPSELCNTEACWDLNRRSVTVLTGV